ncbi:MAG: CCA tRNA nucleotidyltransferase [Paracoccaceae bacterium]
MKVSGDWLSNPRTQSVLSMLDSAGFTALVVGGCVRNALIGEPVADVDIATDALPETVSDLAQKAGLRAVATGIEHGTVTVVSGGEGFEVTSFRRDLHTDGRHAQVAFSADLAQDAARRDFTMNALYARADGTVLDPLGGVQDAIDRRLRFVGDPQARIAEDYLRILRFFRFHAQYGDPEQGLDADALAACAMNAAYLETLSRERIGAEMRKLLSARDPAPSVAAMALSGVLQAILPGADARALPILVHFEGLTRRSWICRLAVIADSADLRLTRAELHDFRLVRDAFSSPAAPSALGYRFGADLAGDMVLGRAAVLESAPPADWQSEASRGAQARFPLKAADLMPPLSGPALGAALAKAEEYWIAQDFAPDRAELVQYLGLA